MSPIHSPDKKRAVEVAAHIDAGVELDGYAAPTAASNPNSLPVLAQPTQIRRPWRSTLRTAFQAVVALAVLFPVLVQEAGLDADRWPWLAIPLAVAAVVARLMANPQVEVFLRRFLPWLAAAPKPKG